LAGKETRRRILDPGERYSEILFGLIMVLTFTGSLSVAKGGHEEVRTMLISAVGCNLAWGIVDAGFYLMAIMGLRGQGLLVLNRLRQEGGAEAHQLIADALPPIVARTMQPEDLERIRQRLIVLDDLPRRPRVSRNDLLGAVGVFLLVFLSTFPVVVPFLVVQEPQLALRVSNAVALVMLFLCGYLLGRSSGFHPWLTGLVMIGLGLVFVGLCISLGG
jgi:VIT family